MIFILFLLSGLLSSTSGQGLDSAKICQSAGDCYSKWSSKTLECNQLDEKDRKIQPYPKNATQIQMCMAENREKVGQIAAKAAENKKEYVNCMKNRMQEVMPVNPNLVDRCTQSLSNYTNMQQSTLPPLTVATIAASGKGKANDAAGLQSLRQNLRLCRQQEQNFAAVCNQLAPCCSENYICTLQAQLAKSGSELIELKLQYEFRYRACNKLSTPKMATGNSVTVGASAAVVAGPSTAAPPTIVASSPSS